MTTATFVTLAVRNYGPTAGKTIARCVISDNEPQYFVASFLGLEEIEGWQGTDKAQAVEALLEQVRMVESWGESSPFTMPDFLTSW